MSHIAISSFNIQTLMTFSWYCTALLGFGLRRTPLWRLAVTHPVFNSQERSKNVFSTGKSLQLLLLKWKCRPVQATAATTASRLFSVQAASLAAASSIISSSSSVCSRFLLLPKLKGRWLVPTLFLELGKMDVWDVRSESQRSSRIARLLQSISSCSSQRWRACSWLKASVS